MPWNDDPYMQSLRLAYNAAVSAHSNCARALTESALRGDVATKDAVEAEAKARARLNEARRELHAAMARAITGQEPQKPA